MFISKGGEASKKIDKQMLLLMTEKVGDYSVTYTALESILTSFAPLRHAQTLLEESSNLQ